MPPLAEASGYSPPKLPWRDARYDESGGRPAALVALVVIPDPVVHQAALAAAVGAAPPQLGVERVQRLRRQRPDLHMPDQRRDVVLDVPAVQLQRVLAAGELVEVALQQLVDGGARPRAVRSVTSRCIRSSAASACFSAPGPAGMVWVSVWRFFVSGSWPTYRRTRKAPLGRTSMLPRWARSAPDTGWHPGIVSRARVTSLGSTSAS